MRQMTVIANVGARKVCALPQRFNSHAYLQQIRSEYNIDTQIFFVRTVVRWLGHCFRHCLPEVILLLRFTLEERLAQLRSSDSETPRSASAVSAWLDLIDVGLGVDFPASGWPGVRGSSGKAIRWRAGWFGRLVMEIWVGSSNEGQGQK